MVPREVLLKTLLNEVVVNRHALDLTKVNVFVENRLVNAGIDELFRSNKCRHTHGVLQSVDCAKLGRNFLLSMLASKKWKECHGFW